MRSLKIILLLTISLSANAIAENYPGHIDYSNRVSLGMTVNGTISTVNVAPGERVNKGQLLISLEAIPFTARIDKYKAELMLARTVKYKTKRDLQHAQELYDRAALSTVDLENAKILYQQADAQIQKITADLKLAKYEFTHSKIHAPFDGWILKIDASPQQSIVNQMQTHSLLTMAPLNKYSIAVIVPLAVARKLKRSDKTQIIINDIKYSGSVKTISLTEMPTEGKNPPRYQIQVEFSSNNQNLMVGENAQVSFN